MSAHGGYLPLRHYLCVWETPNTKTEKQRNNLIRAYFLGKDSVTKRPWRINHILDEHFCEPVTMLTQQLSPLVCLQPSKKHSLWTRSAEQRKFISEEKKREYVSFLFWEWFFNIFKEEYCLRFVEENEYVLISSDLSWITAYDISCN